MEPLIAVRMMGEGRERGRRGSHTDMDSDGGAQLATLFYLGVPGCVVTVTLHLGGNSEASGAPFIPFRVFLMASQLETGERKTMSSRQAFPFLMRDELYQRSQRGV